MVEPTFIDDFVNREEELSLVDSALDTLIEDRRLLRTPVLGFYGIYGIGKTALINKVIEKCSNKQVTYYNISEGLQNPLQYFTYIKNELKKSEGQRKPTVVILDEWEIVSSEYPQEMESALSDLLYDSRLFIILTGKHKDVFDKMSSLSYMPKKIALKPLSREQCGLFVDRIYHAHTPAIHGFLFEWTHGYPAAMRVVIDTLRSRQLDPHLESNHAELLSEVTKSVIHSGFFAGAGSDSEKLADLSSLFSVLSVPRRFNMTVMQDIIERYAPDQYRRRGPIGYIALPREINEIFHVLDWEDASYHIDGSARHIFLLKYSIEQKKEYCSIHAFLADINKKFATKVDGPARIRYICEYCYHLAKSEVLRDQAHLLQKELGQLLALQSPDELLRFYHAFVQDKELGEALGDHKQVVITLLREGFLDLCFEIREEQRIDYWQRFLLCCSSSDNERADSERDFVSLLSQAIVRIKREESREIVEKLSIAITGDTTLRMTLGNDVERIDALLREDPSQER